MSDVMHYNTCIPAATPLWNSGHAVTSAAAPGTALAADRSKLKTALCCWGRRPARHRSGMHNGSVGMGRNVPAKTHSIQRVFCPTQCSTAWSRRSDRHRSGMHQGSVGMGRNVPAQTHIIQGALWVCDALCLQGLTAFRGCFIHSPPSDWLQRSNVMTAACPSLSRWGTAPSARPSHMLRTDMWWRESCMSLSS